MIWTGIFRRQPSLRRRRRLSTVGRIGCWTRCSPFNFALACNLVRLSLDAAAKRQQVDIERISFSDTLRWLIAAEPGEPMPDLLINSLRPDRIEPRAIKRRAKQYDPLNRPRAELRHRLLQEKVAA